MFKEQLSQFIEHLKQTHVVELITDEPTRQMIASIGKKQEGYSALGLTLDVIDFYKITKDKQIVILTVLHQHIKEIPQDNPIITDNHVIELNENSVLMMTLYSQWLFGERDKGFFIKTPDWIHFHITRVNTLERLAVEFKVMSNEIDKLIDDIDKFEKGAKALEEYMSNEKQLTV